MFGMHGGDVYRNEVELDFSVSVNPIGVSQEIKDSFNKINEDCSLYPDPEYVELREAIAREHGVKANHVVCGNGASEIILGLVHSIKPKKILIPVPTFSGYERATIGSGAAVKFWHLKEENDFHIESDIIWELENGYDMVFICNPGNPTGALLNGRLLAKIIELCEEKRTWLVLDNCFMDFIRPDKGLGELIERYKRLIVIKAFTKYYGIPGVRLGYALSGDARMLMNLKLHLPEWNVSSIAQRAGVAALNSKDYYSNTINLIATERKFLVQELKRVFSEAGKSVRIFNGQANYIMFKTDVELYQELLKQKILIRNCANYRLLGPGYYRIAVKNHEDNQRLIEAIRKIVNEG